MKHINHDLRTYRRKSAFTQQNISELLEALDTSQICRLETSPMHPQLLLVMLYELLFDVPYRVIFSSQYKELKHSLQKRIPTLIDNLVCNDMNDEANQKIGMLQTLLAELNHPKTL